ncbi:MAG: hypothetical protein HZY79_04300 [Rhodoblastus sp.]|nr:MAG: hypothetical protein HZY79_04300 [Rhodoblastus sp.]
MLKLNAFSDSDIMILAVVALIFGFVLGLLADVVMGDRGFGPLRNTLLILAGGGGGVALRAAYYPVPTSMLLVATLVAAIAAATVTLAIASLLKKLLMS